MNLQQYQVNAFTQRQFGGNPAAIVPLEEWLPDDIMLGIAADNNLAETAFFVPEDAGYHLRWFTPTVEVELCGHATLASAHTLFFELGLDAEELHFSTLGGNLVVTRKGNLLIMDFPVVPAQPSALQAELAAALGGEPQSAYDSASNVVVYSSEAEIRALEPDIAALNRATHTSTIVTAPGDEVDFVSRFFAPQFGIDEDSVTGSAHCALAPIWSERLGKSALTATQVSERRGDLHCEVRGDRVLLQGYARTFMRGEIEIEF